MKLIRHGDSIVAIIQGNHEKQLLVARREQQEWVPLFLPDCIEPLAEIHCRTLHVRLYQGQHFGNEETVEFRG